MKRIIYLLLLILGMAAPVKAESNYEEITPKKREGGGINFKVIAKLLPDGTTNFKITISSSGGFASISEGSLAVYNFTKKETDNGYLVSGCTIGPVEHLASEKDDHSFTYNFSVPKQSWQNPTSVLFSRNQTAKCLPAVPTIFD